MPPRCPVCTGTAGRVRYRLPRFEILDCAACGLVYLWPQPSDEETRAIFSGVYESGEGSIPELRSYFALSHEDSPTNPLVQLYEHWLAALERHRAPGRLLDIGCGTGLFLAVARRRGWEPFGIDECAEATAQAFEQFGLRLHTGDFATFAATDPPPFDAVTMWDIVEHARQPVDLLAAARRCLAPGGIVGLATPNQRNILDVLAGALYRLTGGRLTAPLGKFYVVQHVVYFTPETLTATLRRAHLAPLRIDRELTELRRLTLAPPVRLALQGLFRIASWTGLETRLFVVARDARGA